MSQRKKHLGVVIVGHTDAGKSTLTGRLLFGAGGLDQRDLAKLKKEAQELGKYNPSVSSQSSHSKLILLNEHKIYATIINRYASVVYSFSFENPNVSSGSKELKFELTIDAASFISSFEANIDNEIFYGKTKEKQTAQKEYVEAKKKE